jgi:hypothetical protein
MCIKGDTSYIKYISLDWVKSGQSTRISIMCQNLNRVSIKQSCPEKLNVYQEIYLTTITKLFSRPPVVRVVRDTNKFLWTGFQKWNTSLLEINPHVLITMSLLDRVQPRADNEQNVAIVEKTATNLFNTIWSMNQRVTEDSMSLAGN